MKLKKNNSYHGVVALGASAGGLESFRDFFEHAQAEAGLSYVVIQHLSPDHMSHLATLLEKHTRRKVKVAKNRMRLEGEVIYVIPPGKNITTDGELLLLTPRPRDSNRITTIDHFLNSLALACGEKATAVIMSGTGSDGAKGISAIKDAGGLVVVQEPSEAQFDGMPISAINTGLADLVLPIPDMHEQIANHVLNENKISGQQTIELNEVEKIINCVAVHTGVNFSGYKKATIMRRIDRRMNVSKATSLKEYSDMISRSPEEAFAFKKDMLIGVTTFFRDPKCWEALRKHALEPLIESKQDFAQLKVWVAGCSTGEEAYSLAIALNELLRKKGRQLQVKIFASDLAEQHIEKASKGRYAKEALRNLDMELLERYFTVAENCWIINNDIRRQIVFSRHNIADDPPFIRNDLICCRNLLIYMDSALQQDVFRRLNFSVLVNGYIFLGTSEALPEGFTNLECLDKRNRIFLKKEATPDKEKRAISSNIAGRSVRQPQVTVPIRLNAEKDQPLLLTDADFAVFELDEKGFILRTQGAPHKFIELPESGFSRGLAALVHRPLAAEVENLVFTCRQLKKPAKSEMRQCSIKGRHLLLRISCLPASEMKHGVLVTFNALEVPEPPGIPHENKEDTSVSQLRQQVIQGEVKIKAVVEELEATNEELQSANEELVASNEELQSSNEELQSVNEELHSLNHEHQQRIVELTQLTDDLENYFRTSDMGQVIVDRQLRIRRFNSAASTVVSVRNTDIGRPLSHLQFQFTADWIESEIATVVNTRQNTEKETLLLDGRTILVKIHPYVRQGDQVDGAVITFVDISAYIRLNAILAGVFDASQLAILVFTISDDHRELLFTTSNVYAQNVFGAERLKEGESLRSISPGFYESLSHGLKSMMRDGQPLQAEFNSEGKWFHVSGVRITNGCALTLTDISKIKLNEDRLEKSYAEMYVTKERLRSLNSSLEEIVRDRTKQLSESEERFRLLSAVTNDAIVDWNLVDNKVWLSSNFETHFGFNSETVRTRGDWLGLVDEEDRKLVEAKSLDAINNGSTTLSLEYKYSKKDGGKAVVFERSIILTDDNDMPFRLLSSMLDITALRAAEQELRESETRLRLALDNTDLAGWDLDIRSNRLIHSKNLPRIFGHHNMSTVKREFLEDQLLDEDREVVKNRLELAKKNGVYQYEARIKWPDGTIHWIRTDGKVLFNARNEPERMLGITRDITAEKNASQQLESLVKERTAMLSDLNASLRKTNEDLARYAFMASHDLQEPLRKIRTFVSLLRTHKSDEVFLNRFLEKIAFSATRMSSLIRSVKEFARLSSSDDSFRQIDLGKLISDLRDDFQLVLKNKKAEFIIDPLPTVNAIPAQLNQLFYNLIEHIIRTFGDEFTIKVSHEIELIENTNNGLERSVLNKIILSGTSRIRHLPAAAFHHLTWDEGDSQDGEWSGEPLLAFCRKVADNHNGSISEEKREDGKVFSLLLPVK